MKDDGYNEYYKRFEEIPDQELWDMYKEARKRIDEALEDGDEDTDITDEDDALIDYFYKFERGRKILERFSNLFNDKKAEKDADISNEFFKGRPDPDISDKDESNQVNKENKNPFKFPPMNLN